MNRADTMMLLNRRRAMWDLPRPDPAIVDEWCRVLADTDPAAAFNALDKLLTVEQRAPSPARILTEIHAHHRPAITPHDEPWDGPTDEGRALIASIRRTLGDRFRLPDGAA